MIQPDAHKDTTLLTLDELLQALDNNDALLADDEANVVARAAGLPPAVRAQLAQRAALIRQHTRTHGAHSRRARAEHAHRVLPLTPN